MPFNFLNQGQTDDTATSFRPIDTFIDPVSKIRVSNPANLIDTDFEYGLQPTKWETVEIINNTPAFFSKSGDTTISDITGITTNGGTREITVTTAFPHNLDVGIPIRVSGTKSLTADGSYIINATPTATTFTYLARANQPETISIFDLYSSIITGEFFQGSQISISDAEGMTTDGIGPNSTLTIKTENKHGFGPLTPFYFLNINSTVSQEFESQNSTSLSFDPTNSATAQSFDGSNTLLQTPINLSNSATTSVYENSITSTDSTNATITVAIASGDADNWSALSYGDPLYYNVNIGSGFFQSNPRGVVFIKNVNGIDVTTNTATFQVSQVPDGEILPILANMTGYFQIADQAKTFAGNNVNEQSQTELNIFVEPEFVFDGGNQGYDGAPPSPPSNVATVVGYTGTTMTVFTAEGVLDYYVGAMLQYNSDGDVATGLSNATTYFVNAFSPGASSGLYNMSIASLPGGSDISVSGGSGTQTFSKIGVSVDKDIVHVKDSNFEEDDMLEYIYPNDGSPGNFGADFEKRFYFVQQAFDSHNYRLSEKATFRPLVATGGDSVTEADSGGRTYKIHAFTSTTTSTFTVESVGDSPEIEYLIVAGGGGGGAGRSVTTSNWYSGSGAGAGGLLNGTIDVTAQNYSITVGAGGLGAVNNVDLSGQQGGNSSAFGLTAIGGGPGTTCRAFQQGLPADGADGGSGGGRDGQSYDAAGRAGRPGRGVPGQGNDGGDAFNNEISGAGGGAGQAGILATSGRGGGGGNGLLIQGFEAFGENGYFAGGGAGGVRTDVGFSVRPGGLGGGGDAGTTGSSAIGTNGQPNTGGGAPGMGVNSSNDGDRARAAQGGSGVVLIRYPITEVPIPGIEATGGTVTEKEVDGILFKTHAFTSTGTDTFSVQSVLRPDIAEVEYLIVAGGGGGGAAQTVCTSNWYDGGGGGAGGLLNGKVGVTTNSYSVVVGSGGAGAVNNVDNFGAKGQNSSAFGLTAIGGGGGETRGAVERCGGNVSSMDGGSGGGRGDWGSHRAGQGISGQGNNGGIGAFEQAGGGGGAGQPGQNAGSTTGGNGGNGLTIGSFSEFGELGTFAGGGGGGARVESGNSSGSGGNGGGGDGNLNSGNNAPGFDALPNTGGGGGGMGAGVSDNGNRSTGGDGGSGVVLITYPIGVA